MACDALERFVGRVIHGNVQFDEILTYFVNGEMFDFIYIETLAFNYICIELSDKDKLLTDFDDMKYRSKLMGGKQSIVINNIETDIFGVLFNGKQQRNLNIQFNNCVLYYKPFIYSSLDEYMYDYNIHTSKCEFYPKD